MKPLSYYLLPFASSLILAGTPLAASAATAGQIAIVPGADVIGRVDIQALNAAPIIKKQIAKGAESWMPLAGSTSAKSARFEAATGLVADDIISVAFSCDIDTLDMTATTSRKRTAGMSGVVAIQVAKPISIAKLKQAIKLEYGTQGKAGVSETSIGKHAGLRINASQPTDPDIYLTVSPNGHLVLMALNAESLIAAQKRITSNTAIPAPDKIARLKDALSGSQITIACIIPSSTTKAIKEQIAKMQQQLAENPGLAMVMGFSQLFQGIKSISAGVTFQNDAIVSLAGDLGKPEYALQASLLLQTIVIPLIEAKFMPPPAAGGAQSPAITDFASVTANGSTLQIKVKITEEQLMSKTQQGTATPQTAP